MGSEFPVTRKPSVLIVDDDLDDLQLLAQILRGSGYDIRQAKDSTQALRSATNLLPDLILLDIKMPGMSGLDFCSLLKSREDLRDVPVIFVTSLSEATDKVKAFALGGVDYISKPYDPDEIKARIASHVKNSAKMRGLETNIRYLEDRIKVADAASQPKPESTVQLTERESECLKWLARGLRNDMIGENMNIKPATVEMHIANARKKLAAATREQALAIAIQLELIKP